MNNLFRTCALLLLLASCNSLPSLPPLPAMLNSSKLPSQLLNIDTERDTTLTLNGGTIITIPANALKADDGNIARLEVKEALTIEQIIVAGLRTQSNGTPLRSGGMIYINAAKDAKVSILKPIQIQVPATEIVDGMQLYKGEVEKNGINWVDPQPLPPQTDTSGNGVTPAPATPPFVTGDCQKGKALFMQNCASCHSVYKKITGPALEGTMRRWNYDTSTLYRFVLNSEAVVRSGHPYAVKLFNDYGKQAMPRFVSFTNQDVNDIFTYIQAPAQCGNTPSTDQSKRAIPDSCDYYCTILKLADEINDEEEFTAITDSLGNSGSELLSDNDITDTTEITDPSDITYFAPDPTFKRLVYPKYDRSYYYTIDIQTFGWYNLDMALKENSGMIPSELSVSIEEKEDQNISVFLVIPSYKIMVQGGYLKDGKLYGFYEEDGGAPLPQGVKAYIIAIAENKYKPELYFGITSFITSKKQAIHLTLNISSEKDIQKQIAGLQLPDFLSNINKKEVSAKMQALGQEAIRVRAKTMNMYCDCGYYSELIQASALQPAFYANIEDQGNGATSEYLDITEYEVDSIPAK